MAMVGAVAAQRLAELAVSRRHERQLRAAGAIEAGGGHHPVMVGLHAAWLVSTLVEGSSTTVRRPSAGIAFLVVQPVRYWAIRTLGDRWTTRVLVLPGRPPITTGPYRFLRHPNYVAVAVELAAVPWFVGARRTAALFSAANAALLTVRVRAETAALNDAGARSQ